MIRFNDRLFHEENMASRILTFFSCTCYLILVIGVFILGLVSFIVGSIGVGLYIPFSITSNHYGNTTCFIVDVNPDRCDQSCFDVLWSVEYFIRKGRSSQYRFSTIVKKFETSSEQTKKVALYTDRTNHTCYYDTREVLRVQWDPPTSPRPFLIMIIVGFSITAVYLISIAIFYRCRLNKCVQ